MNLISITVTASHIAEASRESSLADPISLAYPYGFVGSREIRRYDGEYFTLPAAAVKFLADWESGKAVSPMKFTAEHITHAARLARMRRERVVKPKGGTPAMRPAQDVTEVVDED